MQRVKFTSTASTFTCVTAFAHYVLKVDAILSLWVAYIPTRPFGASIGDYLSQPMEYGGFGLGTIYTGLPFLAASQ
ncbi:hypothetical protein [Rhizobium leguminosarum]|uniref:hypothetical protein n=1 Tax=Rhizobium leguminosarum TaxID=384 RepID=UPI0028F4073D|nr:hypothetical protein [Rhizobium leguminosarum]